MFIQGKCLFQKMRKRRNWIFKMEGRFCPKCKSKNIRMNIPDASAAWIGKHPGWKCNNCGLELPEFPIPEKLNKRIKRKS